MAFLPFCSWIKMKFTTWSFEQLSMINLLGTKKLPGMEELGKEARETILRKDLTLFF